VSSDRNARHRTLRRAAVARSKQTRPSACVSAGGRLKRPPLPPPRGKCAPRQPCGNEAIPASGHRHTADPIRLPSR
jgi:hypothetical protein